MFMDSRFVLPVVNIILCTLIKINYHKGLCIDL